MFGIGEKKRLVVYSGRGRPPKKALMAARDGGQVGITSLQLFMFEHCFVTPSDIVDVQWLQDGESSDEGEDAPNSGANEKAGVDSDYEYSEEETDEEVGVVVVEESSPLG